MPDFEVRGSHELAVLAKRLKDAGEKDLRNQLLAGIRNSAKPAIPDIRQSAYRTLPKAGGLNELVGKKDYKVQARYTGFGAIVRIVGSGMRTLKLINAGGVRHPVYGEWLTGVETQLVTPGFWSKPLAARRPQFIRAVQKVMDNVARQIARRF